MPRSQRILSTSPDSPSKVLGKTCNAVLIIIAVAVFWKHYSFGQYDPYNCRALLNHGTWPAADRHFEKWEPNGCRMVETSRDEFRDCLGGRRVVFAGDSTVRQIYWAAATRLDHDKARIAILDGFTKDTKQQDLTFEAEGVKLEFIWDPWLNSSNLARELTRFRTQETLIDIAGVKSKDEESAGLIVAGAPGLWAARHGGDDYFSLYQRAIDDIRPHLHSNLDDTVMIPTGKPETNFAAAPNQILLAPVQVPWYGSLSPGRAETITPKRINEMNNYLKAFTPDEQSHVIWAYNKMTQNNRKAYEETGIHVAHGVAERKFDITLNVRCNAAAVAHKYPIQRTCCISYPRESPIQPALLFLGIAGFPLLRWIFHHTEFIRKFLPPNDVLRALQKIFFAVALCWIADRTQYVTKVERHYNQGMFVISCVLFFFLSLASFRRSAQPADIVSSPSRTRAKLGSPRKYDEGFLSRDQSDEWKGWMQAIILIYHYSHGSQTLWIYKIVRLLVSAYIFMSAYGHTIFLLKTEDFSLRRMAAVIFRLNALSALLPYMMMTDYTFYYFAPVVTFWYLTVWLTLRIHKEYNQDPLLLLAKVVISAIIMTCFIMIHGPLERLSTVCRVVFRMSWDAREARFRISLERYIAYFGVLTASVAHRIALLRTRQGLPRSSQSGSARTYEASEIDSALAVFVFTEPLTKPLKPIACIFSFLFIVFPVLITQKCINDKAQYNVAHTYMSWVPIVSFIILRNSHRILRNSFMSLPAALGKISLETYILQYHLWLGSDATALIRTGIWDHYSSPLHGTWLSLPGKGLEGVLFAVLFVCICVQARHATEVLTKWLFGMPRHFQPRGSLLGNPEAHKERTSEDGLERDVFTVNSVNEAEKSSCNERLAEPTRLQKVTQFVAKNSGVRATGLFLMLLVGNLIYG